MPGDDDVEDVIGLSLYVNCFMCLLRGLPTIRCSHLSGGVELFNE